MQDLTATRSMAPHPGDNVHTDAPGALLVAFDSVLGQDRLPLNRTKPGTTVTATVTVRSIIPMPAGHARGIVDGDGGQAFIYIARDYIDRLRHLLVEGATVMIRGTHTVLGDKPTIGVFAAREASPAARIVARVADRLTDRPFNHPITNTPVSRCMTDGILGSALATALDAILRTVPTYAERTAARDAVQKALPPVTGTVDEYAALLRAAVVSL